MRPAPAAGGARRRRVSRSRAVRWATSYACDVSDSTLDAFGEAWLSLREVVERLEAVSDEDREGRRDELVAAVDQAVRTRVAARETLAAQYGGRGVGDQMLRVREVEVGAFGKELGRFTDAWSPGGGDLPVDRILDHVRPLLVEPGSDEAHGPEKGDG